MDELFPLFLNALIAECSPQKNEKKDYESVAYITCGSEIRATSLKVCGTDWEAYTITTRKGIRRDFYFCPLHLVN